VMTASRGFASLAPVYLRSSLRDAPDASGAGEEPQFEPSACFALKFTLDSGEYPQCQNLGEVEAMLKSKLNLAATLLAACVMAATMAILGAAQSASPVEGSYDVTATGNEVGTLKFVLVLKRDGDKWSAELKDSPVPMTVTAVSVDGDNVTIVGSTGDSTVTITGKYTGGQLAGNWKAGDATGNWTAMKQGTQAGTLPASSAPAPVAAAAAAAGPIEGTYDAMIAVEGQGGLPFTLIVKRDGEKLLTEVKDGGDINIVGLDLKGDAVTLSATYQGNPFSLPGKRMGSDLGGKWEAGGYSGTWTAKKRAN